MNTLCRALLVVVMWGSGLGGVWVRGVGCMGVSIGVVGSGKVGCNEQVRVVVVRMVVNQRGDGAGGGISVVVAVQEPGTGN